MSVGREEAAIRSLARLHARGDINDPFVIHEAAEIKSGVMFEKESEQGWKKVSFVSGFDGAGMIRYGTDLKGVGVVVVGLVRSKQFATSFHWGHASSFCASDWCQLYPGELVMVIVSVSSEMILILVVRAR